MLLLYSKPISFIIEVINYFIIFGRLKSSYSIISFNTNFSNIPRFRTLLTMNNLKDVETSGLIDFSLILGNLIHTYLSGSLAVSNIWYRGGMTNFILFSTITKYSYVIYNQYLLLIPIFISFFGASLGTMVILSLSNLVVDLG